MWKPFCGVLDEGRHLSWSQPIDLSGWERSNFDLDILPSRKLDSDDFVSWYFDHYGPKWTVFIIRMMMDVRLRIFIFPQSFVALVGGGPLNLSLSVVLQGTPEKMTRRNKQKNIAKRQEWMWFSCLHISFTPRHNGSKSGILVGWEFFCDQKCIFPLRVKNRKLDSSASAIGTTAITEHRL